MKVAIIADVHVGNHRLFGGPNIGGLNERARDTVRVLGAAVQSAWRDGADKIIIAGDLFDTDTPTPAVIAAVQLAITWSAAWDHKARMVLLNGNHDMTSTAPLHTALAPLQCMRGAIVVCEPCSFHDADQGDVVLVPYQPGPACEWLPEAVEKALTTLSPTLTDYNDTSLAGTPRSRLLVLHLGLEHKGTPPWLRGADDSIHIDRLRKICLEHSISNVVAGNWHGAWSENHGGITMRQVGALVPTGFDNPGVEPYGRVVWWTTQEGFTSDTVMKGPRFMKFTDIKELTAFETDVRTDPKYGHDFYVHAQLPAHEWWGGKLILDRLSVESLIRGFKTSKQPAEVRARAAQAVGSVADLSSLGAALFDYIAETPLPEGADLARVHQHCRRLLKLEAEDA